MNIPDLGPFYGNREVTARQKAEKPAETSENTRTASSETEDTNSAAAVNTTETTDTSAAASRDVFSASEDRQRVDELVQTVENVAEDVRADRVEEARQRVASGYYNSEEFLGRLALQITTIGEG